SFILNLIYFLSSVTSHLHSSNSFCEHLLKANEFILPSSPFSYLRHATSHMISFVVAPFSVLLKYVQMKLHQFSLKSIQMKLYPYSAIELLGFENQYGGN
ncbi:Gallate 1-beta-glucosyltransferase, partial [Bienertia sinuspersici]